MWESFDFTKDLQIIRQIEPPIIRDIITLFAFDIFVFIFTGLFSFVRSRPLSKVSKYSIHPSMYLTIYYGALLPRRGPHIASHSVCLSVRPVIITERHVAPPSELQWHTCTFLHALRASVLFGTHWGPHIVRPSRPHKFLLLLAKSLHNANNNATDNAKWSTEQKRETLC